MGERVGLLVAHHILIGCDGLVGLVQASIALRQFLGAFATCTALFAGRLTVGFAILFGSIVILANCQKLITLFHSLIGPAACQQQNTHYYI